MSYITIYYIVMSVIVIGGVYLAYRSYQIEKMRIEANKALNEWMRK